MSNDVHVIQPDDYRVVEREGGFEPQMRYPINGIDSWVALNADGCWADPNDWDNVTFGRPQLGRSVMATREEAQSAITKARRVNGDRPKAVI